MENDKFNLEIHRQEFKLNGNEFKVYNYLKLFNEITQDDLAYELGMSGKGVRNILKILEGLGLITVDKAPTNVNRNIYRLRDKKEWSVLQ